jgi:hypothetical protein
MIKVKIDKKEFDKKNKDIFKDCSPSLFCFFEHKDLRNYDGELCRSGYVFLCGYSTNSSVLLSAFLFIYHQVYSPLINNGFVSDKIKKYNQSFSEGKSEIVCFDGELPFEYEPESAPLNAINSTNSIIEFIAAGYCPQINPNLISSWGYNISK